ncbi:unnamed protein product, partial [Didymodactylos carnosus]
SVPSLTTTVNNDTNKLKKQIKCRNTLDLPVIQFNDALFSYNKRLQKSNKNNTKPPKHLEKNVPETSIFDGSNSPLLLTMAQLNPNLEYRFENKSSDAKEKQPSSSRLSHVSMVRSTDGKTSSMTKRTSFVSSKSSDSAIDPVPPVPIHLSKLKVNRSQKTEDQNIINEKQAKLTRLRTAQLRRLRVSDKYLTEAKRLYFNADQLAFLPRTAIPV